MVKTKKINEAIPASSPTPCELAAACATGVVIDAGVQRRDAFFFPKTA